MFCLWKLTLVLCRRPGDSSKWIQESSGCSWCRWRLSVGLRKPAGIWTVPLQFIANKSLCYCKYIKELISNIYLSQKVSPFLSKQFFLIFSGMMCDFWFYYLHWWNYLRHKTWISRVKLVKNETVPSFFHLKLQHYSNRPHNSAISLIITSWKLY